MLVPIILLSEKYFCLFCQQEIFEKMKYMLVLIKILFVCLTSIIECSKPHTTQIVSLKHINRTQCPNSLIPGTWDSFWYPEYKTVSNYSRLSNLTKLVSAFGDHKCFLGVDNFRGVDLIEPTFPIVLRKPSLGAICKRVGRNDYQLEYNFALWIDNSPAIYNVKDSGTEHVRLVHVLTSYLSSDASLVQRYPVFRPLELVRFAAKSRSWKCEVHIQVLPFVELGSTKWKREVYPHPPLFWYPGIHPLLTKTQPSAIPKIKIWVCKNDSDVCLNDEVFSNWIDKYGQNSFEQNHVHLRAKSSVSYSKVSATELMNVEQVAIPTLGLVAYTGLFSSSYDLDLVLKAQVIDLSTGNVDLISLAKMYLDGIKNCLWWTDINRVVKESYENFGIRPLKYLTYCDDIENFENAGGIRYTSPFEKLAHAHGHIWYTLLTDNSTNFVNNPPYVACVRKPVKQVGIIQRPSICWRLETTLGVSNLINQHDPAAALALPISTKNRFSQLRFISCGERGYYALPFQELIDVFHRSVWICLIVIVAVVPSSYKYLSVAFHEQLEKIQSFYKAMAAILKVLVEQGDNLVTGGKHPHRLKWILAAYILVALVLSNAYKSTNINMMISGRTPMPYYYFEELIQDNFRIYTRAVKHRISIPGSWSKLEYEGLVFKILPHSIEAANIKVVSLISEVSVFNWKLSNDSKAGKLGSIFTHSSLHPGLPNIVRKSYFRARGVARGCKSHLIFLQRILA